MRQLLLCGLAVASVSAAAPLKTAVFSEDGSSVTLKAMEALGVPFEHVRANSPGARALFSYDLIVLGFGGDAPARMLQRDSVKAYVESGGVLVGFRNSASARWLPVPLKRDKGFAFGRILQPDHPLFNQPHRLTDEILYACHSVGSVYNAFYDLGEGWTPLADTGKPLGWDKREQAHGGDHYAIVELRLGKGTVLLTEMIPAYNWIKDTDGDRDSPGARFFENIIRYAGSRATARAATRPEPVIPPNFHRTLTDVLATPARGDGVAMDDGWDVDTAGPYAVSTDRRNVMTITHGNAASQAGNYATASRTFRIPAQLRGGRVYLRFYQSDTYCGGRERILGGEKHGQTALINLKEAHRFKQVLVNGRPVWEEDVLGCNPQPARRRVHYVDITDSLRLGDDTCDVALRVEDRKDSGELPFAIDVFFSVVELLPDFAMRSAAESLEGPGIASNDNGAVTLDEDVGDLALTGFSALPPGTYALALHLLDGANGRSRVQLKAGERELETWQLTADDQQMHWVVTAPFEHRADLPITLHMERDGEDVVEIEAVSLIPERLLRQPLPALEPQRTTSVTEAQFTLVVQDSSGVARSAEMTSQGVPFPYGCLENAADVRIRDATGQPVPVQGRPIAYWPDGSVKSLSMSFPAHTDAKAKAVYAVDAGERARTMPPSPPPEVPLTVAEDDTSVTVDTGTLQVVLSKTRGTLVETVRRPDGTILKRLQDPWDMAVVLEDGRELRSSLGSVGSTEVVERGPLRALIVRKGTLSDGEDSLIDYRLQCELFAQSDAVRLQAFIVNLEDADEHYLRCWSVWLGTEQGPEGKIWLGEGDARPASPGALLYQHREDTLTWRGSDETLSRVQGRAPGTLQFGDVLVGTRWFWQRFPQAIRFEDNGVRQDIIPEPLDDADLPTRWADRMKERTDTYRVGGIGYPQSPGKMGLFRLARGQALRQEMLFCFGDDTASANSAHRLAPLHDRLRAAPDPAYVSRTRVFGELHPVDPRMYPTYEDSVEGFLERYLAKREQRREYGFENFGDDTFEWGYGPSHTYWSNCEYDHHHGFALQYLRSGDPRWWEQCEAAARFYSDVVVIHRDPPDASRPQRGGPHHHNYTALWMPSHEDQVWVADHTLKPADSGHAWAEGVVDYWLLTGDPWAGEVAAEMAEWYCRIVEQNRYGAGGQERGPGWALIALSCLAQTTYDPRVMAAAQNVADWIADWQDPIRGVVSVPISEQPSYEGGTVFMHGIVGRGLGRWYDVTGSPRLKQAVIGIAEWLTTEPMDEPGMFWYKQAPSTSTRHGMTRNTLPALTYAYSLSKNPWFAEVADALFEGAGADVRSLSWYPQVLAHLESRHSPAYVRLSTEGIVVAPDTPAETVVTIRNTTDADLAVAMKAQLDEPFTLALPGRMTLAPGETRDIPLRIETSRAPAEASVDVAVTLTAAAEETVRKDLQLNLRAFNELRRVSLSAADAAVTPPMRQEHSPDGKYLLSPRPEDFAGKPLSEGNAVGGSAEWTVELDEPGRFALWAEVNWLDTKGNSFYITVDDGTEAMLGNVGTYGVWLWVEGPECDLQAGKHRIQIRAREEGAKLRQLWLSSVPGDHPGGLLAE